MPWAVLPAASPLTVGPPHLHGAGDGPPGRVLSGPPALLPLWTWPQEALTPPAPAPAPAPVLSVALR